MSREVGCGRCGQTALLAVEMALGQEPRGLEEVRHSEVLGPRELELDLPARLLEQALRRPGSVAERPLDVVVLDHELAQAPVDPAQDLAQHIRELALALGPRHARRGREVERMRVPGTVAVPHHRRWHGLRAWRQVGSAAARLSRASSA